MKKLKIPAVMVKKAAEKKEEPKEPEKTAGVLGANFTGRSPVVEGDTSKGLGYVARAEQAKEVIEKADG